MLLVISANVIHLLYLFYIILAAQDLVVQPVPLLAYLKSP